jgi:hypothetical protein
MKFKIEVKLNDGMAEAPPMEVDVTSIDELHSVIEDDALLHVYRQRPELHADDGVFIGVGASITIERLR